MLFPVVTIDASMSVSNALSALAIYPSKTYVILRRREGEKLYWYIKRVREIRRMAEQVAQGFQATTSLGGAFGLHEYESSKVIQISEHKRPELAGLSGVLLDGERVIGVLEPRGQKAMRGAQPPVPESRGRDLEVFTGAMAGGEPKARPSVGIRPPAPPAAAAPRRVRKNGGGQPVAKSQPFTAFPSLTAPNSVAPAEQFELSIGLAAQQQAGTAGGQMTVEAAYEEFDLNVQVIAPDFEAPEGIRKLLHVKRSEFEKAVTIVKLVAPVVQEILLSTVEVEYSYRGNLIGRAWREIRVVPAWRPVPVSEAQSGAVQLGQASPSDAPDLTVTINIAPDDSLNWAFTSPHDVELPTNLIKTKFDKHNAQTFAIDRIKSVADYDGSSLIDNKVKGLGRIISDNMPSEFWNTLSAVWKHVRKEAYKVPTLLIISEDPYVPWELASTESNWIDQRLIDTTWPPLLGAQVKVGRWLKQNEAARRGISRPKLPPDTSVSIQKMALVVGDYRSINGQRELPEAREEGKELSNRYPSVWVNGEMSDINRLLDNKLEEKGEPVSVQAVHFAAHGEVSPESRYNGIILSDSDLRLGEDIIVGNDMTPANQPFVFVNACQLGQASEILGDYGGLAGAFLREGCRGFVAPLWSIDDKIAHEFAIQFYKRALDESAEVSEVMRELRSKFDVSQESPPATFIAYVFYGHPKLVLRTAF